MLPTLLLSAARRSDKLRSNSSQRTIRLTRQFNTRDKSQIQYKKRHARLKNGKSSTTRSHVVATITTILIQYTFDGQHLKLRVCE
ncbi:hypothetical protein T4B_6940 [Trichinella pseudospiralis]|uniref:Uncharacterized protein n=1 Tax=Trichinella pseudospiralis TaxID=6337 RepID=A0A0V1EVZ6_TRIPS|nr:hypothetical protein T4A_6599 [Trichinella pseudospiralis]KRZ29914.1 hypothetical protein T4B_6940 [Trichinella pseudospiralis]KRZ44508.1 hypothetical protein T4C_1140 [Trichinella pseudospiralis]